MSDLKFTDVELVFERQRNNPSNLDIGHFTGRCGRCASANLWTDETAYGCNHCNAFFATGDIAPRKIENGTGRDLGPAW